MDSVWERYNKQIKEMMANTNGHHVITEENILQEANLKNREIFYTIVEDLMLPGSKIRNFENLIQLHNLAKEGKSTLILMEHYSNFDLPSFFNLIERADEKIGKSITESLIAMAGMKLNEESPVVLAFTESFSRIVIYPSRSLKKITDPEQREEETQKSKSINLAAMKAMTKAKYNGKTILVFPAGTRYRPGHPETKKAVPEMDSYLKSFEYAVFIGINGNILHINESGQMQEDLAHEDVISYTVSPVIKTKEFRNQSKDTLPEGYDVKQWTADRIMKELEKIHEEGEIYHQNQLSKLNS
ncbi:hypothetical protein [Spirochaeta cellobiosiphila]|uniref:hypothetical protein n=1 Tax=Spirochaeta cellobiosiphila TaxID=504483 RepID=UPI00040C1CAC|nr:hypothetical protein [Spirochaeta cellobiosiphila]